MNWTQYVRKNEATAVKRRLYFHLVDATDGYTPETSEAAGQPEISTDGAAFTSTGIAALTAIGNGDYYADLTQSAVNLNSGIIRGRYKSANTREARSLNTVIVGGDLGDAIAFLSNTKSVSVPDGAIKVKEADGTTDRFTLTPTAVDSQTHNLVRS